MGLKKESIEQLVSLERLDASLKVVGIRGWAALFFCVAIVILGLLWSILGSIPLTVSGKAILFDIDSPGELKILAFVPLDAGQQVKAGMQVQTSLDVVDADDYGMIQGVVEQVSSYPISPADPSLQSIPSASLRDYLVSGSLPSLLVVVKPAADAETTSGWKWTSPKGPPIPVKAGMLGEARITIEEMAPIEYVLPFLRGRKHAGAE
ncbi:MAG: hypothetical protein KGJ02_02570 [Verrucomicrobiota bacterium]|nr:hypothetical protein [Verrucomicrobiota bacterium]